MPTSDDVAVSATETLSMNPDVTKTTTVIFTVAGATAGAVSVTSPFGVTTYEIPEGVKVIAKLPTEGATIDVENTGTEIVSVERDF
jgi:Asp-tRNA(Asn)/Glu-tRNA(Gln) amidotransferase A subunit family amidase